MTVCDQPFRLLKPDSELNANEPKGKELTIWQIFAANKLLLTGIFNEPDPETAATNRFP